MPVDDLIEAAGLVRGSDDLFAPGMIEQAPGHLRAAAHRLRSKVHALLDRTTREVYVDPAIHHAGRRRFRALHEVGHDILPSQSDPAHADDRHTLSWSAKAKSERDANQAAAELMFLRRRFSTMAADYRIGLAAVTELSQRFECSIHAAFRRYAEFHAAPVLGVVLDPSPVSRDPDVYRRFEAISSPTWETRFGRPECLPNRLEVELFEFLRDARQACSVGHAAGETRWLTLDNEWVDVKVELMSTTYRLLALVWVPQRERLKLRRRLVPAPGAG